MSEKKIENVRSFIAIDFPKDLLQRLAQVVVLLENNIHSPQNNPQIRSACVRWVKIDNMHLTLKFLGDVASNRIASLEQVLKRSVEKKNTFDLTVRGLGAFPRPTHPTVIWAGIDESPALSGLVNELESQMANCGFAPEERAFRAHLTLGRVARNLPPHESRAVAVALLELLPSAGQTIFGRAYIDRVHFYRSDLDRDGARYTRLFSVALHETR
jgi:2'-5' RNA ligase